MLNFVDKAMRNIILDEGIGAHSLNGRNPNLNLEDRKKGLSLSERLANGKSTHRRFGRWLTINRTTEDTSFENRVLPASLRAHTRRHEMKSLVVDQTLNCCVNSTCIDVEATMASDHNDDK